jgi:MauM/NapG family ferredoxin protein
MNWTRWRRVRQGVQLLALGLYVYLLFAALQRKLAFPLADLYFRLDPLAALGAMLAGRAWIPRLAPALATLALTLLFGRAWCGWLCPLGTLLEWVRAPSARERAPRLSPRWRSVKHLVLLLVLAMALFGGLFLLVLDPIALLTRTMTTAVLPALNHAVTAVERVLYGIAPLRPVVSRIESVLRGPVLPVIQPVFGSNVLVALLFGGVLALNALADRFWCRYLCPLGALLGLLSRISLLRPVVRPACNRCGHCAGACRLDAIDTARDFEIVPSECTVCLDCLAACPESAGTRESGIGFRLSHQLAPALPYDPTRRQALIALASGAAGIALLRTGAQARQPDPHLIRPPGVLDEAAFLNRCVRCSQCLKVCPTSGLQPVLLEAGLEGLWTPRLVPRLGHCDYGCTACGQVCPSGAIPPLEMDRKREQVMGVAAIDRNRCLPWAEGTPCIVCEEMCPVPDKAIHLQEGDGVQQPIVDTTRCIGCGICEFQCPVEGEAAIRVYRQ